MKQIDSIKPAFVWSDRSGNPHRFVLMAAVKDLDETYVLIRDLKTNKNHIERARATHAHPDVYTCDYEQIEDDEEWKKVHAFFDSTGILKRKLNIFYTAQQIPKQ